MTNKDKTLQKAIDIYGCEAQIDMFHEEIGELMQAINKVRRLGGINPDAICHPAKISFPTDEKNAKYAMAYYNLCSEVADAKIMVRQLELMLDQEAVNLSEERKIDRLQERLNK